jgi:DNA-binding MarR family transcriptional regulator
VRAVKLTSEEVQIIRALSADGVTQQAIADQFGVHQSTVSAIIARKIWTHI